MSATARPRRRAHAAGARRLGSRTRRTTRTGRAAEPRRRRRTLGHRRDAAGRRRSAPSCSLNSDRFQRTLEEVTLPLRHEDIIRQQAAEKGVPADLIAAVIYSESRFRDQTSHAGARGLMQITPSTAKVIEKPQRGPDLQVRGPLGPGHQHPLRDLLPPLPDREVRGQRGRRAGGVQRRGDQRGRLGRLEPEPRRHSLPETRDYVEDVLEKRDGVRPPLPSRAGARLRAHRTRTNGAEPPKPQPDRSPCLRLRAGVLRAALRGAAAAPRARASDRRRAARANPAQWPVRRRDLPQGPHALQRLRDRPRRRCSPRGTASPASTSPTSR